MPLLLLYLADSSSERSWDVTSSRKPSSASVMGNSCVQVCIPPMFYLEDQSYILLLHCHIPPVSPGAQGMLVKQMVKVRGTTVTCFYLSFDLEVSQCPVLSDSLLTFLGGCSGQLGGDWRWILGQILTELKRRRDQGRAERPKAAPP